MFQVCSRINYCDSPNPIRLEKTVRCKIQIIFIDNKYIHNLYIALWKCIYKIYKLSLNISSKSHLNHEFNLIKIPIIREPINDNPILFTNASLTLNLQICIYN